MQIEMKTPQNCGNLELKHSWYSGPCLPPHTALVQNIPFPPPHNLGAAPAQEDTEVAKKPGLPRSFSKEHIRLKPGVGHMESVYITYCSDQHLQDPL